MSSTEIFHITEPAVWHAAAAAGSFTESTRGKQLEEVGYIHCSFAEQVEMVANFLYSDWDGGLVLLAIDASCVPSEIRVENLDGGEDQFPHIYGPVPLAAITAVHDMTKREEGWILPGELSLP